MKEIFYIICLFLIALTAESLTIEKARMNPLQGYVLTDSDFKVVDESGVRIGPLDLRYLNPELMDKIGLSPDMIELLSPYTQIYGENALTLVRGKPFRLTREQYETLESRMKSFFCQIYDSLPPDQKNDPTVNKLEELSKEGNWPEFLNLASRFFQAPKIMIRGSLQTIAPVL